MRCVSSAASEFVQRPRRERIDIAASDALCVIELSLAVWFAIVMVSVQSTAALITWASLTVPLIVTAFVRGLRSHVEVHDGVLRLHRWSIRSIPLQDIREVSEARRYRRVSTTRLVIDGGRTVRTKAAAADQIRQLLSPHL